MPSNGPSGPRRATVVGAGPGGSVAALLLAAAGWRVTLLERVAEPAAVGAGILLQPNGLAVLYGLGLRDAIRAQAHEIRGAAIRDPRARVLLQTRVPDLGAGLDHLLALRRAHLATVLADAVAATAGIDLHLGAEVRRATPEGTVTYRSQGVDHTVDAELVVAADGVHSRVRTTAGFAATTSDTAHTYLRAIVDHDGDGGNDTAEQTEHWTPLGLFGSSPLGDGTTYFFADADAPAVRDAIDARDVAALRAAWSGTLAAAASLVDELASIDELLVNQVQRVDAPSFRSGRVALLGDAAHAMAPNLGQGANSALVDAVALVEELAAHLDVEAALDAYDARRRPAVRKVQRDAERLARAAGLRNGFARWLRDTLVARTPASASARRFRAVQQEDPATLLRSVTELAAGRG
jgi:2-polyprenyl-6-methoxyphenol hydroxylase-like FAD-dependent oxidoreductase